MDITIRIIQCVAWLGAAYLFDQSWRADPVANNSTAWLFGVLICGFGAMYAVTFLITLVRFGPKAARSMKWY